MNGADGLQSQGDQWIVRHPDSGELLPVAPPSEHLSTSTQASSGGAQLQALVVANAGKPTPFQPVLHAFEGLTAAPKTSGQQSTNILAVAMLHEARTEIVEQKKELKDLRAKLETERALNADLRVENAGHIGVCDEFRRSLSLRASLTAMSTGLIGYSVGLLIAQNYAYGVPLSLIGLFFLVLSGKWSRDIERDMKSGSAKK